MKTIITIIASIIAIIVSANEALPKGCVDFVKSQEGLRLKAYWDVNRWSIGYGTPSHRGEKITESEASKRLEKRLLEDQKALKSFFKRSWIVLSDNQKTSLISLRFNIGTLAGCPKLKKFIIDGDYNSAAKEFLDITVKRSKFKNESEYLKVYKVLKERRQRESKLFMSK